MTSADLAAQPDLHDVSAAPLRIRVIVNPNAGLKAGLPTNRGTVDDIRALMETHGLGDELVLTATEEEAIAAAREAAEQRYDRVVAVGGDGTFGVIAGALLGAQTALAILPLGSVMNVARMLGVPRDLDAAAAIVATGHVRTIDVGEAKGQLFFEGGSVGLNAAVFREAQRVDAGHYHSLVSALWVLLRYRPPRMVVHLDERVLTTRALALAVANGPYSGLGFTVAPRAELDDGKFEVVIFSRFSRTELIRYFAAIAFGRRRYTAKTATYRSTRVRVDGVHPLPCRVDSHDLGSTPVEFVVHPAALRVVVPPPS